MRKDVLHSLAVSWTTRLNRYAGKEGADLLKMVLGIEILLHNVPKLALMVTGAMLLGNLTQSLAVWLPFAIIRRYASGLHASNSIKCTVLTMLMFVGVPYVLWGVLVNEVVLVGAFALIGLGLYRYAPADTEARPIIGKLKRERLKRKAVAACVVLLVVSVVLLDMAYYVLVLTGALFAVIAILPLVYRIFRRSVNNYEQFE